MTPAAREHPPYVHTGPETPAGRYLRRFWQPVFLTRDLAAGRTAPIRVLHQDFTIYRGEDGRPHIVAARCPHRGALLSLGHVVGSNLRCMYHGWAFAETGRCVDQPAEPVPFCQKVHIASYPTHEALGVVFGYFGDGAPPPFPDLPVRDEWVVEVDIVKHPCNYFQRAENNVDGAHVQFVHGTAPELGTSIRASKGIPSAEPTPFGLTFSLEYPSGVVEKNHFIMPNSAYLSLKPGKAPFRVHFRWWYVPIDDVSHNLVAMTFVVEEEARKNWIPLPPAAERPNFEREITAILSGAKRFDDGRLDGATHVTDIILGQDAIATCSLGPIAPRHDERLGRTDVGVILLRKLWSRELELVVAGAPMTRFSGLPREFPGAGNALLASRVEPSALQSVS
jgi:5,5'-dehydrodivanillate O-demethylase oxygenase subunit